MVPSCRELALCYPRARQRRSQPMGPGYMVAPRDKELAPDRDDPQLNRLRRLRSPQGLPQGGPREVEVAVVRGSGAPRMKVV